MKKIANIWIIVVIVIIAAVIGAGLSVLNSQYNPPPLPPSGQNQPGPPPAGDLQGFYTAKTIISIVNIALILVLLVIYIDMYRKLKSKFTLGLITVMLVLLLYAITSNPMLQEQSGFHPSGLGIFAMIPDLFTMIAIVILLYLTLE